MHVFEHTNIQTHSHVNAFNKINIKSTPQSTILIVPENVLPLIWSLLHI